MPDAGCPVFFTTSTVLYCQQCSLLPAVFFTANALKYGFYSRRFSNSECLDLEFLIYRPSSIIRRLSSNYSFLFVSRLFFTQKYPSLNPHMEHILPLTDEQWAKIESLIPPPESAATRGRPPIDERLVLDAILWKLKHPFFGCRSMCSLDAEACVLCLPAPVKTSAQ